LKNGHGEEVCTVLTALCEVSIKNKFKFKRPVIKDDGANLDNEADDMDGDDMDGRADLADVVHAAEDDEDIDEEIDFGVAGGIQHDLAK
jgi:hypothetical protein